MECADDGEYVSREFRRMLCKWYGLFYFKTCNVAKTERVFTTVFALRFQSLEFGRFSGCVVYIMCRKKFWRATK